MIARARTIAKRLLASLPVIGHGLQRWSAGNEQRYLRRRFVQEMQARRDVARDWSRRITDVLGAADNARIPRVPDAGTVRGSDVIMHNGLRIAYGTYGTADAEQVMRMLVKNCGVHEPQEEFVFQQVLPLIPAGATMLELGAFWGFYSLWFRSAVPDARCILVEPEWPNLNMGRLNFALNGFDATFINAYVGCRPMRRPFHARTTTVDQLRRDLQIPHLHLLHSDIQGYEREMLEGAADSFAQNAVDWVFISTHSALVHAACRAWLRERDCQIVADLDLEQSCSVDGLLVAHRPGLRLSTRIVSPTPKTGR